VCRVRIKPKENSPRPYDMGERIRAKDETKRDILWGINTEVGGQVRQGKGNRIKETKEGRTGVRGQEKHKEITRKENR